MAISVENQQKNSNPVYIPAVWVLLGIPYWCLGSKNYNDGANEPRKELDYIFSRLDTIHERD